MMIKSLTHLGSLRLAEVKGPKWELVEEEFPSLKRLTICRCNDLLNWNVNSSHFPVLETFHFIGLPRLSEIPFEIGDIPTLQSIRLHGCSASAAVSAMRIGAEQESMGNNDLQLDLRLSRREEERFQKMVEEEGLTSNSLRRH